jgi:hypothetical protein
LPISERHCCQVELAGREQGKSCPNIPWAPLGPAPCPPANDIFACACACF